MQDKKIECYQEQLNGIVKQCYAIHSLGCLLELDRTGDNEIEVLEALNHEPVSNVISNAARVIKEKAAGIISAIEAIEHEQKG
jgi:hypothetical protein